MKNIIRIISLIFVVTAIGGCGKSQQHQKSTDFPKGMKTELTEQIKVNAEFQYPENCKNGKCAETQISGQTLWDKQEEIAQLLVQDGNITNEYIDDYGTVQYKIYEIAENNATLVISDDNLNYATDQASYINNVLFSDSRFDDYNGNKYLQRWVYANDATLTIEGVEHACQIEQVTSNTMWCTMFSRLNDLFWIFS